MNLTIEYLLNAYRSGETTPERIIDDIVLQCEHFVEHNIWIRRLTKEELSPYLQNLEGKSPDDLPLYGIPFAIKDNIDLAGIPTTAGCQAFEYIPEKNAFVVEQLLQAGAIPVGKTNMDQFATGLVGVRSPEPWGPCRNSFDPDYISGGSSSGSAVAVALGLVSFSLGTDTAGSGRVPAALNNIIGLKPSKGLLSMSGVVPACRSLDCVSIFALTTDDADRVLESSAIYDAEDCYARPVTYNNNSRHYLLPKSNFKFAVPREDQLQFFGEQSAKALFEDSVQELESIGGEKITVDFSPFLNAARLLYEGPWVAERYVAIEELINSRPETLLPVINSIIGGGKNKTAADVFKAEYKMQAYRKETKEVFSNFDFLLTPTIGAPYTIEQVLADPIKLNSNLGYYTNYMNLLDCASVAMPAGFLTNGLPWGISFVSTAMNDRLLLSFANRWQQKQGLSLGKTELPLAHSQAEEAQLSNTDFIPIIVCGAHLKGLPLNWQLTERGARFIEANTTSKNYQLYSLAGGSVQRPALVKNDEGHAIEVEIWELPAEQYGSFVAGIPTPLGIGKVELSDGRQLPGFICEHNGIKDAQNISEYGGWKKFINKKP